MSRAVGYCRVSTEDQSERGFSLAAQEEKIRQYAALYGHELTEIVIDPGYSAKSLDRPGVARVLEMMKKKQTGAVIVAKLDRLTRSVRDLADIVEIANRRGVALVSVAEHLDTSSAAGRMVMNLLASVSQWEREAIGERTSAVIQHKKHSGQSYSGRYAPYGFERVDGALAPVPEERAVVGAIMSMRPVYSLREIAVELDRRGMKPRNGGQWHPQVIAKIASEEAERQARVDCAEAVG
jgi:site-specific DNA recombinase